MNFLVRWIEWRSFVAGLFTLVVATVARGQFDVPSHGGDGVFAPTASIEIDLSKARLGNWDEPVPPGGDDHGPFAGRGIYDPAQWFIAFHYQSVNIPAGVIVTFKNHPKNPPVVWLVQGDVVINGQVSLSGRTGTTNGLHSVPGPGGFAGGRGSGAIFSGGFGPGGGGAGQSEAQVAAVTNYGNSACFPLIGGSGGGANNTGNAWTSGGGGGAILIASGSTVSINEPSGSTPGGIQANGGWLTGYVGSYSYSGGGMIRLAAPVVAVLGRVEARAFGGSQYDLRAGRIRIEANTVLGSNFGSRFTIAQLGSELRFTRDVSTPTVKVVSVNASTFSQDPDSFVIRGWDPSLPSVPTTQIAVRLECENVPANATVVVYLRSTETPWATTLTATRESGDDALSIWTVTGNLGIQEGRCTVQAKATLP